LSSQALQFEKYAIIQITHLETQLHAPTFEVGTLSDGAE